MQHHLVCRDLRVGVIHIYKKKSAIPWSEALKIKLSQPQTIELVLDYQTKAKGTMESKSVSTIPSSAHSSNGPNGAQPQGHHTTGSMDIHAKRREAPMAISTSLTLSEIQKNIHRQ